MSKAVLISIQPKWCAKIERGEKTVEVRKTRPKIETPFKVYIYQTRRTWIYDFYSRIADWQGKVIGGFVCDEIYSDTDFNVKTRELLHNACLTLFDIAKYLKPKQVAHFWHISNLKIYDKPKELSEFRLYNVRAYYDEELKLPMPTHEISRPPQSWCYVEEING